MTASCEVSRMYQNHDIFGWISRQLCPGAWDHMTDHESGCSWEILLCKGVKMVFSPRRGRAKNHIHAIPMPWMAYLCRIRCLPMHAFGASTCPRLTG